MKTIHKIIEGFKNILGFNALNKTPQLIPVTSDNFCQNMANTDNCCDENNLFI
ncbi:hypothetical protein [Flavobacterium sp. W22_SRS_FP1]|uniref:hypothetical protein n=1 Tax=Flavobacterium sp. W22_SRS_FP1 TaxID=3240276 RepID=UPI003F910391